MKQIWFICIWLLLNSVSSAQGPDPSDWDFTDIKEILLDQRPQTGDYELRKQAITRIDQLIPFTFPPLYPGTKEFMQSMVAKAILEIKNEVVTEGASIWQIYNHGFVVKTPTACFGFDLYDYFPFDGFLELAYELDALFISHSHGDHYSRSLISKMDQLNKPVAGPSGMIQVGINKTFVNGGVMDSVGNLEATAHFGLHSTPVVMFEITTPEGIRILHTGDNQTSETLPWVGGIDILLLNSWVNESGQGGTVLGTRNSLDRIKPKVCLPGHFMELGHLGGNYVELYQWGYQVTDYPIPSEFHILAWGERFHYPRSSNDSVRPATISEINYEFDENIIRIRWDHPVSDEDGDTAAFYRVVSARTGEVLMKKNWMNLGFDSTGTYNFCIYSYDHCGNQCESPAEIDVVIPHDLNFRPRITNSNPVNSDTITVFSGVAKVFSVEAYDLNEDSLSYSWILAGDSVSGASEPVFTYDQRGIETGLYPLTLGISDGDTTTGHTWVLRHYADSAVVDDQDELQFTTEGDWLSQVWNSTNGRAHFCLRDFYTKWAGYYYIPESPGVYDLYAFIPEVQGHIGLTTIAQYIILINGQSADTFLYDQKEASGSWGKVGRFRIKESLSGNQPGSESVPGYVTEESPDTIEVRVSNISTLPNDKFVFADAISYKFVGNPINTEEITRPKSIGNFTLSCYPNPARDNIHLSFQLKKRALVNLDVFNILGGCVDEIYSGTLMPGQYEFNSDISALSDGIYYYRLRTATWEQSGILTVVR